MTIEREKSLKSFNTFGIDVTAKYFTEIRSVEEYKELRGDRRLSGEAKVVLGGGSNILLTKDFDGWVIKNAIPGGTVLRETETEVILKVGAGVPWHDLVEGTLEKNYAGLENLSLIPGLVGAAPIQNIGAYGAELKDCFHELEAIDLHSGGSVTFSERDCAFGYRDSVFKHKFRGQFLISAVSFRLTKLSSPKAHYRFRTEYGEVRKTLGDMKVQDLSLRVMSDAVCRIRRAKLPDPKEIGNAGSFFKNPSLSQVHFKALASQFPEIPHYSQENGTVKIPAGWLLEACGWKGKKAGRVGTYKNQALVLVNYGGATGQEILEFSETIASSVKKKFGIELSREVNVV